MSETEATDRRAILEEIAAMSEADARTFAGEVAVENRRLRRVLRALTEGGFGAGGLVEVYSLGRPDMGLVVCSAGDEVALGKAVADALGSIFAGAVKATGEVTRAGVTRLDLSDEKGSER
jgi:hypothetical protein